MKLVLASSLTLFAGLLLASCATTAAQKDVASTDLYHYVRSNRDGSNPEHVTHFRPSRTEISVYKWVEKCTTAAYVTSSTDQSVREARRFVAGKVAADGTQAAFGTLTLNPQNSTLDVDLTPAGASRMKESWPLPGRPFLLYDFDLADLNAFLQEARPAQKFSYRLPVIWPAAGSLFRDLGQLHARFVGNEEHLGFRTARYALRVEGPTPSAGNLWVEKSRGFIVEVDLGLPNHDGYRDFRLKLDRVQKGGREAWTALLRSHFAGC